MLSRNLVIASMAVVLLASTVSPAPVEDKEPEESDFEAEEGEEELSEEEEDDDDSKGQHMKGAGSHQATAAPKGSGSTAASSVVGESPNGQKPNGGTHSGQVSSSSTASNGANGSNGRDGHSRPSDSSSHGASYGGQEGSKSEIARPGGTGGAGANAGLGSKVPGADGAVHSVSISVAGEGSPGQMSAGRPSAGQTLLLSSESQSQHEGSETITSHADGSLYESEEPTHDGSQIEPPEIPDVESNGNGHKHLLNGGELGFTGFDHFLTSSSQTDGADLIDSPPDVPPTCLVTDAISADHASQLDSTAGGQSPGKPSLVGSVLDITTELDHLSVDNGNGDSTDPIDISDNGFYSTTDPADNGSDNGADSSDTNGNGRHKPVADIQKGEPSSTSTFPHGDQYTASSHPDTVGSLDTSVHTVSPFADPTGVDGITGGSAQTDMAGALAGLVTGGQTDQTGHGQLAVTDGMPNYTDLGLAAGTGFTDASQTHSVILQTDLSVTDDPYAASSQTDVAGTALGEAQATLGDSSRPAATEQTQTAVSAGEQYHTSGQGPEGAENVELEDTC